MDKKEFYNYLKEQPFCGRCSKCICDKTIEIYNDAHYTKCCQQFLYIAKQYIKKNNFKKLCLFLRKKYNGKFPDEQTDTKWFIPFFKNNSLELE